MSDEAQISHVRDTLSADLLRHALDDIDHVTLAGVIGAPIDQLQRWSTGEAPMNLSERMAVVMAVIALAPVGSDLFRNAARVRAQLAAVIEYETGVTSTDQNTRRFRF
jgi:hypothetical protein